MYTLIIPRFCVPEADGLRPEEVVSEVQHNCIVIVTTTVQAHCPVCGESSSRIQSRYLRSIVDVPWLGKAARLLLQSTAFVVSIQYALM